MKAFAMICIVLFAVACGGKKQPATTSTPASSTMKADGDKDSKVDEAAKDKNGDKDDKDDEGPAKGAKKN